MELAGLIRDVPDGPIRGSNRERSKFAWIRRRYAKLAPMGMMSAGRTCAPPACWKLHVGTAPWSVPANAAGTGVVTGPQNTSWSGQSRESASS